MLRQATLPLASTALAETLPAASAWLAGSEEAPRTRYLRQAARRALEPSRGDGNFEWQLDPYVGFEFEAFPTGRISRKRIILKDGLQRILETELRRPDTTGSRIVIGRRSDPYQPVERFASRTRALLETLTTTSGLDLTITTRSPLVLRDLEICKRLDLRHAVTLQIVLPTMDARLARLLERPAIEPRDRLEVVQRYSADGITVQVLCSPILAGINSDADELNPLFAAVRAAGANDIGALPLEVAGRNRRRFFSWLREEFPDLVPLYLPSGTLGGRLSRQHPDSLLGTFERLRLAYGFPTSGTAGRG